MVIANDDASGCSWMGGQLPSSQGKAAPMIRPPAPKIKAVSLIAERSDRAHSVNSRLRTASSSVMPWAIRAWAISLSVLLIRAKMPLLLRYPWMWANSNPLERMGINLSIGTFNWGSWKFHPEEWRCVAVAVTIVCATKASNAVSGPASRAVAATCWSVVMR